MSAQKKRGRVDPSTQPFRDALAAAWAAESLEALVSALGELKAAAGVEGFHPSEALLKELRRLSRESRVLAPPATALLSALITRVKGLKLPSVARAKKGAGEGAGAVPPSPLELLALPPASVASVMARVLPRGAAVDAGAAASVTACATEFAALLGSEAAACAGARGAAEVGAEDIVRALRAVGFYKHAGVIGAMAQRVAAAAAAGASAAASGAASASAAAAAGGGMGQLAVGSALVTGFAAAGGGAAEAAPPPAEPMQCD